MANYFLKADPTYAEIVTTCKRYDKAMEQQRVNFVVGEAHRVSEKAVVCSYPKCGKKGHSAAHCWIKKKGQEKAQLKRTGRSRNPKKTQREPLRKSTPQKYPRRRGPCYVCGAEGHRAFECTERADLKDNKKSAHKSVTLESTKSSEKQKTEIDWNRFTRRSERDGEDEESDETHMIDSCSCNNDKDEVNVAEDDDYVYLDSCASKRLFILRNQSFVESFVYSGGSIQATRADALLSCLGSRKYGDWLDIRVCNDAVKNICSAGLLRDMGYGLQLLRVPRVVRLIDGKEVLTAKYLESGMPYIGLSDLLHLPNISRVCGDI